MEYSESIPILNGEIRQPSCLTKMKVKYHIIKNALKEKNYMNLHLFMLMQAVIMPTFPDFSYLFAVDV